MQSRERGIFVLKKKKKIFDSIKAMTVAAMLTAISVIIGIICKNFLNFGGGLFRITFENLPIIMSGILYGPIVGGLVGVASDLVSYLLSSQIYPPNLIVTAGAAAVGVISGAVSRYVVKRKGRGQIIVSGAIAHVVGSMIIKPIGLYTFYGALVLWRIPLYLIIAPIEISLLCILFGRSGFCRLTNYYQGDKNDL